MSTKTFLSTVNFSKLTNWSVQYLINNNVSYSDKYALTPIKLFLIRSKIAVEIADDKNYKRVTIKTNNGGVFLRDIENGKKIGTKKQFAIKKGQFILSKIDARNGAFGVANDEVDGAIITGNFWAFDVKESLVNPHFLSLVTTTPSFIKFSENASNGTTNRHYLQEKAFLDQEIPLPSLEEQNEIVEFYSQKIKQAELAEQEVDRLEEEIENYIYSELGIPKQESHSDKKKGLEFVRFKNISRWDTDFLLNKKQEFHSKYELTSYGSIFKTLKNGIAARNYNDIGIRYLKVSDIKNNSISNKDVKYVNKIKKTDLLNNQTLLITRKGTVGQSYFLNSSKEKVVASSEIFIIELINNISGDYISEINLASFVQNQYKEKYTGTVMPSLSQEMLKSIIVPLPPLSKQNEIVAHITILKEQMKALREQAEQNKQQAIKDFENKIFS